MDGLASYRSVRLAPDDGVPCGKAIEHLVGGAVRQPEHYWLDHPTIVVALEDIARRGAVGGNIRATCLHVELHLPGLRQRLGHLLMRQEAAMPGIRCRLREGHGACRYEMNPKALLRYDSDRCRHTGEQMGVLDTLHVDVNR